MGGDAVFGHQAGLYGVAQLALQQALLQRGRHGLAFGPELEPAHIHDVLRSNDGVSLAGRNDGLQEVGVGFRLSG